MTLFRERPPDPFPIAKHGLNGREKLRKSYRSLQIGIVAFLTLAASFKSQAAVNVIEH